MAEAQPLEQEIFLSLQRTIDAPVDQVYSAWTDPELMRKWFAPGELKVARAVAEVEVGGTFLVEMHGTDGESHLTRGVYREVIPNRRLVHTWQWEGSDIESLVTVEFEPGSPSTTQLTLTHSRFADSEARDRHEGGWNGCLLKLSALFPRQEMRSAATS
ncbi:MAG: SRPBCC domain-containing protein [Rhodospirillales bacterium]|nr:SRPBCC domain-containing protein [Rhodospirillales bacterium]